MNYEGVKVEENEELSRILGCGVDVLDYSGTETGTHKIIKAREAFRRCPGNTELLAITSGNYGAALRKVAEELRRKVWLIIGEDQVELAKRLRGEFSDVEFIERLRGDFPGEPALRTFLVQPMITDLSRRVLECAFAKLKRERGKRYTNVTSHVDIRNSQEALGDGVKSDLYDYPIYDLLGVVDGERDYSTVFVPAGGGELLHDVAVALSICKTRVFGVSPMGHPSITGTNFKPENFTASFADKLMCPTHQMAGVLKVAQRISRKPIEHLGASEGEFEKAYRLAQEAGLVCEPSGAAACTVLLDSFRERHHLEFLPDQRVLIVNTGDGRRFTGEA